MAEKFMAAASRQDGETGAVESVGFLEGPAGGIFVYAHIPREKPTMGFIVCPPLLGDFVANYRREVEFARRLVTHGIAVWRFHYPGTGNSDGAWRDASFATLHQTVDEVVRHLTHTVGDLPIGMVGTRMSAFVAADRVALQPPEAPIVLWDPVVNPKRHFRQAFRAESMRNLKEKRPDGPSVSEMISIMAESGTVDVLGYSLPSALYFQALELDLGERLRGQSRRVLLATIGAGAGEATKLADVLRMDGMDVSLEEAGTEESWWFDQPGRLKVGPVVTTTIDWLTQPVARP